MGILADAAPLSIAARPELTGGRRIGVLLSHGFTGSPVSMRAWGQYLGDQGYAVEVPRLPGHGTTWREMNRTTYDEWYTEVERSLKALSASCDAVVVGGLSMGGSLVLRLAAEHPEQVAGVVLVNPGVTLVDPRMKVLPVLKHVVPSFPGVGSDIKKPGIAEGAYDRVPLKALASMLAGWARLRPRLKDVVAPVLYFHSTEDHVVTDHSSEAILSGLGSSEVTYTRLENSYHVATMDNDADQIFAESAAFVARVAGGPSAAGNGADAGA